MAADKTNAQRLVDLKAALTAVKPKGTISLADCAALWGVTKPRFVNKRAEIAGFPDGVIGANNSLNYPAAATIKAMIAFLDRHHKANAQRVERQVKLIGGSKSTAETLTHMTPAELATLNRLRSDVEYDEREQGQYCPIAEQQRIAGEVFSELSEFLSALSNQIDPHGRFEPEIRVAIDSKAHEALLKIHSRMKGLLAGDALRRGTGAANKPTGRTRTRRQRK